LAQLQRRGKLCAARPLGLPPLAYPAKGRPQAGAKMAKSPARPSRGSSKSASKIPPRTAARAGAAHEKADGGDAVLLARIAGALERLAPATAAATDFATAEAFVWHPEGRRLNAVRRVNRVGMSLLKGIDRVRDLLVENTERFARGLPANNALLWGARGMGKSSLVKAVHEVVNRQAPGSLALVEIHRPTLSRFRVLQPEVFVGSLSEFHSFRPALSQWL